jgi:anti-sigma B factor antagonist
MPMLPTTIEGRGPVRAVARRRGVTVVLLQGELDVFNAPVLRATLEHECARRPERLVVDLTDVDLIDATALKTLVAAKRGLADWRALTHHATTPVIQRTLESTGVGRGVAIETTATAFRAA